MTDVTSGSAAARLIQADHVYVGWRFAQAHPDPGPPPAEPEEDPEPDRGSRPMVRYPGESLFNRPLKVAAAGTCVGVVIIAGVWAFGVLPGPFALAGLLACGLIFGITGYSIWQGEQAVRDRARDQRARLERDQRARERKIERARQEYALGYRDWERRRAAYDQQQEWHPVAVPSGVDRIDVAGGTLAGWSAAVTMMGTARLAAGSQVTVVDLSEGAVAADRVRLAAEHGEDPLVWVLPDDLPRLDLTRNLGPAALADVLSLVVGAGEEKSGNRDLSVDNSILERVLAEFGGTASVRQVTAALRALAQVGDPRDDLRRGLLSEGQLDRILMMFGRGAADKVVIERAWALESQLRKLEALGTDPVPLPSSGLRVVSMDRRAGVLTNKILGTYVTTALTHGLRAAPAGARWNHTLFLCGAEKLRGDVLDRLTDACETTGTGLVLFYRTIPKPVRQRLGRGHAAVGFMRVGNADDARIAAQYIGSDHSLTVAGVTESAGEVLAALPAAPYSSTVAYARRGERPLTDPIWTPAHRPHPAGPALVESMAADPTWAGSVNLHLEAELRGASRELRIEQRQLQELPPTAMVFTHATATGRQTLLVDANPGIMTLPAAQGREFREVPPLELTEAGEPGPEAAPADDGRADITGPRHAAPRGTTPRVPRGAPPLRPNGRHSKPS